MEQQGWLSAGAFDRATRAVAGRLHAAGLRRRDRVILSAAPSVALVKAYVAALRLGLVVVPLNPGYREREVTHVVRDAEPPAAIVDDAERGAWIRRAAGNALILGPDVELPDGNVADLDDLDAGDPALICYTSGTTGSPKGAVLAHGNLLASAQAIRLAWRWSDNEIRMARDMQETFRSLIAEDGGDDNAATLSCSLRQYCPGSHSPSG